MKLKELLFIVAVISIVYYLFGCVVRRRTMILYEGDSAVFESGTGRLIEYTPKPGSEQERLELRRWWIEFRERFDEKR